MSSEERGPWAINEGVPAGGRSSTHKVTLETCALAQCGEEGVAGKGAGWRGGVVRVGLVAGVDVAKEQKGVTQGALLRAPASFSTWKKEG